MRKVTLFSSYTGGVAVVLGLCPSWQPAAAGSDGWVPPWRDGLASSRVVAGPGNQFAQASGDEASAEVDPHSALFAVESYPSASQCAQCLATIDREWASSDLDQQIVVETAGLQVMGDDPGRPAADDQYATGLRYQIPLTNTWIRPADAMYGPLHSENDVAGPRMELRVKC